MTIESLYQFFLDSDGVTTDTRNLKKGGIFFALKGANFNGNLFAQNALDAGCKFAIVDEEQEVSDNRIIRVEDVLLTLHGLANYHRKQFNIPIIGITGSNGKTTTKELAGAVLSKKYNTLITKGNLNNHLGVPFTLLRLNTSHEIAIIEMGANKPGDIKELVEIAEPTHGIISNVGAAHIEGFGSLKGVIKTKTEMYRFIAENKGSLFLNAEDDILVGQLPINVPVFTYGQLHGDVQGELQSQNPFVSFSWKTDTYNSPTLTTNLVGRYNFVNFLSAIAIGTYFEVRPELINEAICEYSPSNNRSQVTKTDRNTLIVDCYNANATSMKAALESFAEMAAENKLVILGDMLELGDISQQEHEGIVRYVETEGLNAWLVGAEMMKVKTVFQQYPDWEALVQNENLDGLKEQLILLKGSRGIRLEELIPLL